MHAKLGPGLLSREVERDVTESQEPRPFPDLPKLKAALLAGLDDLDPSTPVMFKLTLPSDDVPLTIRVDPNAAASSSPDTNTVKTIRAAFDLVRQWKRANDGELTTTVEPRRNAPPGNRSANPSSTGSCSSRASTSGLVRIASSSRTATTSSLYPNRCSLN